jgi:hypothetical protein
MMKNKGKVASFPLSLQAFLPRHRSKSDVEGLRVFTIDDVKGMTRPKRKGEHIALG